MLRNGRGKMAFAHMILALVLMVTAGAVHGDVAQGGPEVSAVALVMHSAGDLESTFEKFTAAIDRYAVEKARCEKIVDAQERAKCDALGRKLLEEAGDLLAKLNEQADSIESAVAINKKRMGKDLSEKLDRVLGRVVQIRQEANTRMKAALARG